MYVHTYLTDYLYLFKCFLTFPSICPLLNPPSPSFLLSPSRRKDKVLYVITNEGEESVVSYEYLLFTNGTQYVTEQEHGLPPPAGVFALNSAEDEEEFGKWAEELLVGGKGACLCVSACLFMCAVWWGSA